MKKIILIILILLMSSCSKQEECINTEDEFNLGDNVFILVGSYSDFKIKEGIIIEKNQSEKYGNSNIVKVVYGEKDYQYNTYTMYKNIAKTEKGIIDIKISMLQKDIERREEVIKEIQDEIQELLTK